MRCDVTYDELAALPAGDLSEARMCTLRRHVEGCPVCVSRLKALQGADRALASLPRAEPSAGAFLRTLRALSDMECGNDTSEIMTLEDVARFLHVPMEDLSEITKELPAFELGGRIRVRRGRLMAWIEQRERAYSREAARDRIAQVVPGVFVKGVA